MIEYMHVIKVIVQFIINNDINIKIRKDMTAAIPHHHPNRFQLLLQQLTTKMQQFTSIKQQLTKQLASQKQQQKRKQKQLQKQKQLKNEKDKQQIKQQQLQLCKQIKQFIVCWKVFFKNDLVLPIKAISQFGIDSVIATANFYQSELKKCRGYYQAEVWDLREEIKRQYKVIALMKQEVEDLMMLMKYQSRQQQQQNELQQHQEQPREQKQTVSEDKPKSTSIGVREYAGQLETIQEQTQRTLLSSDRSHCASNNQQFQRTRNFIKIEEKEEDCEDRQEKQIKERSDREGEGQSNQKDMQKQSSLEKWKKQLDMQEIEGKQCEMYNGNTQNKQSEHLEFNQSLTPESNSKDNQIKPEQKKVSFFTQKNQICYHSQVPVFPSPAESTELTPVQSRIRTKIHTAPSDNHKSDHLQSIFFLDDEPEEQEYRTNNVLVNTSLKMKKMQEIGQKIKFYQSHSEQSIGGSKAVQYRQAVAAHQDQYTLIQDNWKGNRQRKGQVIEEDIIKTLCKNMKGTLSHGQFSMKHNVDIGYQKPSNEGHERKTSKSNRTMTQQQTSEYINRTFNKAVLIQQFQSSSSVPISTGSHPLTQLSPNIESEKGQRSSLEGKPKTKQFLEQFRKTFNKCLKSMQVSKKNSTKLANNSSQKHGGKCGSPLSNQSQMSGVMTFGKSNQSSNYSSIGYKQIDSQSKREKQNWNRQKDKSREKISSQADETSSKGTLKAVDHMLKQLENNNKFVIGNKKIQLKYEGEKKNGVRSGNGILYYSNGLCYEGEFKQGVRHGYGILKFNHIQIYNGDWVNDEIEGQGKIRNCAIINKKKTTYCNQTPLGKWISYSGQFKNSKFEGSGTLYLQGGEKFVGHFQNGYACGDGYVYKKNGEVDHGVWKNNYLLEQP